MRGSFPGLRPLSRGLALETTVRFTSRYGPPVRGAERFHCAVSYIPLCGTFTKSQNSKGILGQADTCIMQISKSLADRTRRTILVPWDAKAYRTPHRHSSLDRGSRGTRPLDRSGLGSVKSKKRTRPRPAGEGGRRGPRGRRGRAAARRGPRSRTPASSDPKVKRGGGYVNQQDGTRSLAAHRITKLSQHSSRPESRRSSPLTYRSCAPIAQGGARQRGHEGIAAVARGEELAPS